jgi:lysylphosphatidylglycerol synthetase-like protein (DUF2156 family)
MLFSREETGVTESPYAPPRAHLGDETELAELPAGIARKIKNAWLAGVFSTALTTVFALASVMGASIGGLDAYAFVDVVILGALSFGVYKRSRVCAVLLLAFFVLNKIIMWMSSPGFASLPLTIVLLWFYFQGVAGTFQAHGFRRAARAVD